MTGAGTQNDSFIVDNWADFRTIDINSAEIFVRWADSENKIIDFNDILPEGFTEIIYIPANVDFNGWTFRNFHSTAGTAFYGVSNNSNINNLILENFYFTGQYLLHKVNCANCIFSGIAHGVSATCFGYSSNFTGCSANLRMHSGSESAVFSNSVCRNSDITLDITGNRFTISYDGKVYNSRFSGKIQIDGNNIMVSIGYSSVFNLISNKPLSCSSATGISVFNADTMPNPANANKNLVGLTSEQLKNAEYLYNMGFPIGYEND